MRKVTRKVVAGIVMSVMIMSMAVATSANEVTDASAEVTDGAVTVTDSAVEVTGGAVTVTDSAVEVTGGAVIGEEKPIEPLKPIVNRIVFPKQLCGTSIIGPLIEQPSEYWGSMLIYELPEDNDSENPEPSETLVRGGVKPYTMELEGAPDWIHIDKEKKTICGRRPRNEETPEMYCKLKVTDAVGNFVKIDVILEKTFKGLECEPIKSLDGQYDIPWGKLGTEFYILFDEFKHITGGIPPYKFEMANAPDWIHIDEKTGALYGVRPNVPRSSGMFYVYLKDSDNHSIDFTLFYGGVYGKVGSTETQDPINTIKPQTPAATPSPTNDQNKAPQTGDDFTVWLVLSLCSVGGLAISNRSKLFEK